MKAVRAGEKGIWLWSIGGALATLALVPVLFHGTPSEPVAAWPLAVNPSMGFRPVSAADTSVSLLDPTPLFLPTEWNAKADSMPVGAVREPGSTFGSYAATPFYNDSSKLVFPVTVQVPEQPVGALEVGKPLAAFAGIGRTDREVGALDARDAFIEVRAEGNDHLALELPVKGARPPGDGNWQPLEFLAVVEASGLVSAPTLVGFGSGSEQVDAFFRNYLASNLRIGERLAPGFYRIKIAP